MQEKTARSMSSSVRKGAKATLALATHTAQQTHMASKAATEIEKTQICRAQSPRKSVVICAISRVGVSAGAVHLGTSWRTCGVDVAQERRREENEARLEGAGGSDISG